MKDDTSSPVIAKSGWIIFDEHSLAIIKTRTGMEEVFITGEETVWTRHPAEFLPTNERENGVDYKVRLVNMAARESNQLGLAHRKGGGKYLAIIKPLGWKQSKETKVIGPARRNAHGFPPITAKSKSYNLA